MLTLTNWAFPVLLTFHFAALGIRRGWSQALPIGLLSLLYLPALWLQSGPSLGGGHAGANYGIALTLILVDLLSRLIAWVILVRSLLRNGLIPKKRSASSA